jgi:hypothetical protein
MALFVQRLLLNQFLYDSSSGNVPKRTLLNSIFPFQKLVPQGTCILYLILGVQNIKTRLAAIIPSCISLNLHRQFVATD